MELQQILSAAWRRIRKLVARPGTGRLPAWISPAGLRSAFEAWRARRQPGAGEDFSYTFRARSYPGSRKRHYRVYVPAACDDDCASPLVMVLHGCRQDNRDIEQITDFNRLADQHRFIAVYPFVTSYRGLRSRNCWGWWFDREIHAGSGEVEDLWQIVEEIGQRHALDRSRIHVTGLSSGAGMTVAMLVAHSDKIASGAAVAGIPYAEKAVAVRHGMNRQPRNRPVVAIVKAMRDEMGRRTRVVPIQILHSRSDEVVDIKSAQILRDSWGHCFGIDTRNPDSSETGELGGTAWEHSRYHGDASASLIETVFLEGPGHGWYGGRPGNFSFPDAPDISAGIWNFFESHPLA